MMMIILIIIIIKKKVIASSSRIGTFRVRDKLFNKKCQVCLFVNKGFKTHFQEVYMYMYMLMLLIITNLIK